MGGVDVRGVGGWVNMINSIMYMYELSTNT